MYKRQVDHLILLDTKGRAYSIPASDIPGGKGDGVPATSLADFVGGGKLALAHVVSAERIYLVASDGGYGFRCRGEDFLSRGKAGKAFLTLGDGESPTVFMPAPAGGEVACLTRDGRCLVFPVEEIRLLPRGRGLKLIAADPGKTALGEIVAVVDGAAGKLKGERLELCRGSRGGRGKLIRISRR